jgi:hypothetical protein
VQQSLLEQAEGQEAKEGVRIDLSADAERRGQALALQHIDLFLHGRNCSTCARFQPAIANSNNSAILTLLWKLQERSFRHCPSTQLLVRALN